MLWQRIGSCLLAVSAMVLSVLPSSQCLAGKGGTERPFKGVAKGTITNLSPPNIEVENTGNATHLGRFTRFEKATLGPNGAASGTLDFVAANGDLIKWEFSGTVCLEWVQGGPSDPLAEPIVKGRWDVTFDVVGGDGRFKNVSGTRLKGAAINPPFNPFAGEWPFDWFVNGTIDLGKKGKKK